MRKCKLSYDMWLCRTDTECSEFDFKGTDDKLCKTCKWYERV